MRTVKPVQIMTLSLLYSASQSFQKNKELFILPYHQQDPCEPALPTTDNNSPLAQKQLEFRQSNSPNGLDLLKSKHSPLVSLRASTPMLLYFYAPTCDPHFPVEPQLLSLLLPCIFFPKKSMISHFSLPPQSISHSLPLCILK